VPRTKRGRLPSQTFESKNGDLNRPKRGELNFTEQTVRSILYRPSAKCTPSSPVAVTHECTHAVPTQTITATPPNRTHKINQKMLESPQICSCLVAFHGVRFAGSIKIEHVLGRPAQRIFSTLRAAHKAGGRKNEAVVAEMQCERGQKTKNQPNPAHHLRAKRLPPLLLYTNRQWFREIWGVCGGSERAVAALAYNLCTPVHRVACLN
jgi:hypothetical protein